MSTTMFEWIENGWRPTLGTKSGPTFVESFLVNEGLVRNLGWHQERFLGALRTQSNSAELGEAEETWRSALQELPRQGRWFPRIEAHREENCSRWKFRLWLRPAPQLELSISGVITRENPRRNPRFKGPDLDALGALKKKVGGEPVLLTSDGHVAEGATTSIVWWEKDGSLACSATFQRVPSTTERALIHAARRNGIPVRKRLVKPEEWCGLEVWALNALHGLRPFTQIVDEAEEKIRVEEPVRAEWGRRELARQTRPLPHLLR